MNLPDHYALPRNIFDPQGKPELVYSLCQAVRDELDNEMMLSTVDHMLVRWALTKQSGLQQVLQDKDKSAKLVDAINKASGTKLTLDDVKAVCWNEGDSGVLAAVAPNLKDN